MAIDLFGRWLRWNRCPYLIENIARVTLSAPFPWGRHTHELHLSARAYGPQVSSHTQDRLLSRTPTGGPVGTISRCAREPGRGQPDH